MNAHLLAARGADSAEEQALLEKGCTFGDSAACALSAEPSPEIGEDALLSLLRHYTLPRLARCEDPAAGWQSVELSWTLKGGVAVVSEVQGSMSPEAAACSTRTIAQTPWPETDSEQKIERRFVLRVPTTEGTQKASSGSPPAVE